MVFLIIFDHLHTASPAPEPERIESNESITSSLTAVADEAPP